MQEQPEFTVTASRLALTSRSGARVFGPLSFRAPAGSLVALCGPTGTGRTSLLLALAGRMRATNGSATVHGLDVARNAGRVRELVGLGEIARVNELEEATTCAEHVAQQRAFRWGRRAERDVDVLALVGLELTAGVRVRDLDAEQRYRLGVALALMGDTQVLALDDLDRGPNREQSARVLTILRDLAETRGLTILYACCDELTADAADVVVPLGATIEMEIAHALA